MVPSSGCSWAGLSCVALLTALTIRAWQAGRIDTWGHLAVGWGMGVTVSLSHSRLARVGTIGYGRDAHNQRQVPGPSVAPAALPSSTVQVSMAAVTWIMSPPPFPEVSVPYTQELVHTFLSMAKGTFSVHNCSQDRS